MLIPTIGIINKYILTPLIATEASSASLLNMFIVNSGNICISIPPIVQIAVAAIVAIINVFLAL